MRTRGSAATRYVAAMAAALFLAAGDGTCKQFADPPTGWQGPGGPGPGGPGPMGGRTLALRKRFDQNKDGWLNATERKAARAAVAEMGGQRRFGPGMGGRRGSRFGSAETAAPKKGATLTPASVPHYPGADLYDPKVLRTLFLDFEEADWEAELSDFHNTDVEVAATLTVDGKRYPNVGVRFRGNTSFMMVPAGYKRPLNIAVDMADPKQRLYGHKTLNLLNAHEDPSLMGTVLYSSIARRFTKALRANYVRLAINGESWGVYVNLEQFDNLFLARHYGEGKYARWKAPGSPGATAGLDYKGDSADAYKRVYEQKSGGADDWTHLISLCRVLNTTPPDKLEQALRPVLDIDNVLWFLVVDIGLANGDGYWTRASDYTVARDPRGVFRVFAHDTNESFRSGGGMMGGGPPGGPMGGGPPGGPMGGGPPGGMMGGGPPNEMMGGFGPMGGFGRGPGMGGPGGGGAGGADLDPLYGLSDTRAALRARLLAVPALRARYLQFMRRFASEGLDWKTLGPEVASYRALIDKEVQAETRNLSTYSAFQRATAPTVNASAAAAGRSIRAFAEARRSYLLSYTGKALGAGAGAASRPAPAAPKGARK